MKRISQSKSKREPKIIFIINSLELGGAEKIFFNIINNHRNALIITLISKGFYGNKLLNEGYKLIDLKMKKNIFIFFKIFRLINIIKRNKPEIVHTWLYHSNLIGSIAAKFAGVKKIYWSIHHDFEHSDFYMFIEMRILTILSHFIPNKILYSSFSSEEKHILNGYNKKISIIIQNGISISKFKPKKELRFNLRKKLKIKDECFLLCNISRYHPIKDHETLLRSLKILKKNNLFFKCILIGNGLTNSNIELSNKIRDYKLQKNVLLYGKSFEVNKLLNAFDLNILSSKSECSPVTLLEAMACGVPCVSTNVGNAKTIIGNSGWIVETGDPEALASCIHNIFKKKHLLENKSKLGIKRVRNFYTLEKMRRRYRELYN